MFTTRSFALRGALRSCFGGLALASLVPPALADVYTSVQTGVAIPDVGTVELPLVVDDAFEVTDVNVLVSVQHARVGDLILRLRHPDGSTITLLDREGDDATELRFTCLDDEATLPLDAGAEPFAASFTPAEPLSAFDGKPAAGTWFLSVRDVAAGSTGTVRAFSLAFNGLTFVGEDLDVPLPDVGAGQSTLSVAAEFVVADVDLGIDLFHTWPTDAVFYLTGPEGAGPFLTSGPPSQFVVADLPSITLDDGAKIPLTLSASPHAGRFTTQSGTALSYFNGSTSQGIWRLTGVDTQFDFAGTLRAWWLHLTPDAPPAAFDPCAVERLVRPDTIGSTQGATVALSGSRAVVGNESAAYVGSSSGAVYVFDEGLGGYELSDIVYPLSVMGFDFFGSAVDVDGDVLLAGARQQGSTGAGFVFERVRGDWVETAHLVPAAAAPNHRWGAAVALDGAFALLGNGGNFQSPESAVLFQRVKGQWVEAATLVPGDASPPRAFGASVAIRGDFALVGAPGLSGDTPAAYVFERGPGGWAEVAKLVAPDAPTGGAFGRDVALGDGFAVVGARAADVPFSNCGAAHVFEPTGPAGAWVHTATLLPPTPTVSGNFGSGVSAAGDRLAVGYRVPDRVAVYERSATGFVLLEEVVEPVSPSPTFTERIALGPDRVIVSFGPGANDVASVFGLPSVQSLYSCDNTLSVASGGTHALRLYAGVPFAGHVYLLLGSASGSAPGLPVQGVVLPLNFDAYFMWSLERANQPPFDSTLGVLDPLGSGSAAITLPAGLPPAVVGLQLVHAYLAFDPMTASASFSSVSEPLTFVP